MCKIKRKAFSNKESRNKAQSNYMQDKEQLKFTLTKDEKALFENTAKELGISNTELFRKVLKNLKTLTN